MWRKAMVYLGLGDDAEYDDHAGTYGNEPDRGASRERGAAPPQTAPPKHAPPQHAAPAAYADEPSGIGSVRPISSRSGEPAELVPAGQRVTPSHTGTVRPRPQVVRPLVVTPNAKPFVVMPTSFNQAQDVADRYKGSQPVIMNLQGADKDLSRRLIDFASGLCYGLGGQMERVANQVYLMTPTDVEVSSEERRRLHQRGYDT